MRKLLLDLCPKLPAKTLSFNNFKKTKTGLTESGAFLSSLWLLILLMPSLAAAQSLPAGVQEYYVLGRDSQVFDFCYYVGHTEAPSGSNRYNPPSQMVSIVTVTATMDGQTIVYDHWEDGYDPDPFNINDNRQSTTETKTLNHGQVFSFKSDGSGTGINAVIPIPRVSTDLRYDGGDRIISLGGPVNLAHAMWPNTMLVIADAWEVYPRQALSGFYTYRVPVGENSYTSHGGASGTFAPFKYVVLQVAAYEDNTTVVINNGLTQVSFTLNQGQTYSTRGWIEDQNTAPSITVRENTLVTADKDIQAGILTGSDGTYQTRFYNMIPLKAYGRDYIVPVQGGPTTPTNYPVNIYLFNPNSSDANVTLYYPSGQASGTISAFSSTSWMNITTSALPTGTGARITSDQLIWGVVAYDYNGTARDWGLSLIPTRYLRSEYYVSWSPVDNTPTIGPWSGLGGGNPIWITPLQDNTTVQIYLNTNGVQSSTPDSVDTDGDGQADSATSTSLNVLQVMKVYDQTDGKNDGTHIVASGPVAVSYGQDSRCDTGGDSLDLGYAVLPLTQDFLSPIITVTATPSPTSVPSGGGYVTVTMKINAGNYDDITGIDGWLNLNSADISYVAGSTTVTAPGFSGNIEPTKPSNTLTWNLAPHDSLDHDQQITIEFQLHWDGTALDQVYPLQAGADATYLLKSFHPHYDFQISKTYLQISKQVNKITASAGDTLLYTITAHNTSGSSTVPSLVVSDPLNEGLTFDHADNNGAFSDQTRTVTWNTLGNLAPDATIEIHFYAVVRVLPEAMDLDNQASGTATGLPIVNSNKVTTSILVPLINITKSASPTSAAAGDEITFTLFIENSGQADAASVVIRDLIPTNTTYESGTITLNGVSKTDASSDDEAEYTSGGITVHLASLAIGNSATVTFKVTVNSGLTPGSQIANVATSESASSLLRSSNIVSISVFRRCNNGSQCTTSYPNCVDGVCCNTTCGGGVTTDCQACSVAYGAATNGTCGPSTSNTCNDSNLCTQTDTCQAGVCIGTKPVVCPEPDQCHKTGVCAPSTGQCSYQIQDNGTSCNDGDLCTPTDTCQGGICTGGTPKTCTALDQCHVAGTCEPSNGECSNPLEDDGIHCEDGNLCTLNDACLVGNCIGDQKVCTALDQCHQVGTCDTGTGLCSDPIQPNDTNCEDGGLCTLNDTCQNGSCVSGTPKVCVAQDECHDPGTCSPSSGTCSNPIKPDNTSCDSGLGHCVSGVCQCNDRDNDGICDQFDICPDDLHNLCHGCTDSDGDGICDVVDPCPTDPTNSCQACTDTDHDGICDSIDPCPTDATNTCNVCVDKRDPDGDGKPNCVDPCPEDPLDSCIPCNDRDHDGICDAFDICPDDPTNKCNSCTDTDNDGICDVLDPCPTDPTNTCQACTDTDGDKICDDVDPCPNDPQNTCGACRDPADSDGDGLPNCVDPCPNDKSNSCIPCNDRDHDGICDLRDFCPDDPQNKCTSCPDQDNDGLCDAVDPCLDNPDLNCTCSDSDGDGICDTADPCPNDPTNTCSACRDTSDPDKDDLPNCVDACPNDPTNTCMKIKVSGGGCSCGTTQFEFGGLLPLLLGLLVLRRYRRPTHPANRFNKCSETQGLI